MSHMFQDQFPNKVHKVSKCSIQYRNGFRKFQRMLINELLNKDPDTVPEEAPIIILDSKYAVFMYKNGKDTKHTRHIDIRVHLLSNGEK